MPHHAPHHDPHHDPHHGPHGWIEFDRKDSSRADFGRDLQALGDLIAESSDITFGDVLISFPEEVTVETVFERNAHGKYVLRVHAEWPEYQATRNPRSGRSPKFGTPGLAAEEG